jgi:hypothetical protein
MGRIGVSYPERPEQEMKNSSTNLRFILAYTLLVGVPLLGLAGILKAGRNLRAPLAVDGVWKVDAVTAHPQTQSCIQAHAAMDSLITISQSGRDLVLTSSKHLTASGSGMIDGTDVSAAFSLPDSPNGCGGSLTLRASVDAKAVPKLMNGTLSFKGCASCPMETFRAGMQARSANSETH